MLDVWLSLLKTVHLNDIFQILMAQQVIYCITLLSISLKYPLQQLTTLLWYRLFIIINRLLNSYNLLPPLIIRLNLFEWSLSCQHLKQNHSQSPYVYSIRILTILVILFILFSENLWRPIPKCTAKFIKLRSFILS